MLREISYVQWQKTLDTLKTWQISSYPIEFSDIPYIITGSSYLYNNDMISEHCVFMYNNENITKSSFQFCVNVNGDTNVIGEMMEGIRPFVYFIGI